MVLCEQTDIMQTAVRRRGAVVKHYALDGVAAGEQPHCPAEQAAAAVQRLVTAKLGDSWECSVILRRQRRTFRALGGLLCLDAIHRNAAALPIERARVHCEISRMINVTDVGKMTECCNACLIGSCAIGKHCVCIIGLGFRAFTIFACVVPPIFISRRRLDGRIDVYRLLEAGETSDACTVLSRPVRVLRERLDKVRIHHCVQCERKAPGLVT